MLSIKWIGLPTPSLFRDWVALTSLHSWTYNNLPSDLSTLFDEPKELGRAGSGLAVLQSTPSFYREPEDTSDGALEDLINKRQQDGYTLIQHRTVTGDVTAAMIRGQLTPSPTRSVRFTSLCRPTFGTDLQILDPQLSLMDVTYAAAWQLGKTLGMGG